MFNKKQKKRGGRGYQCLSAIDAGLDLRRLLLQLLCAAKQPIKRRFGERDGRDCFQETKRFGRAAGLPPCRAAAAVHLRVREADASQYWRS